jgi:hypothetical protein
MPRSSLDRSIVIASLLTFVLAGLTLASAQVTFTSNGFSSGDYDTASIVTGDFNNDGILDLVTINATSLSFYKGLGGGKFAEPLNQPVTNFLGQAVAADFDGDGKLDLAVGCSSCSSGGVTILLGNGNGTFTAGQTIATEAPAAYIDLADFNGDHIPDIAASGCSSTTSCSVQVFLGQGNGTFKLAATINYGGGQIVAGDFNADGHQDLAFLGIDNSDQLVMALGNGNGTFENPILVSQPNATSLAVGDFYNDRIQSLALLSFDSSNYYVSTARYSNGTVQVSTPQLVNSPNTPGPYNYIVAGDLNSDFLDDVVLTGGGFTCDKCVQAYTSYMLGKGNGTFQSAVKAPAYGQYGDFPFIRDLNHDSRHDIGIAWDAPYEEQGGGAFVLLNNSAVVNCAPPYANALSVNICAPTKGQTVGSTFTFKGSGNAFNGIAKRMELWIDGKKVGQNLEDQLKVTATLTPGTYTASFVVVDSFDNSTSKSVTFKSSN